MFFFPDFAILARFWEAPGLQKFQKIAKICKKIDFGTHPFLKSGSGRVSGGFWKDFGRIWDGVWKDFEDFCKGLSFSG